MSQFHALVALVLAAGKGTRMKSGKAKVLHEVFSAPMIHHVLHAIAPLRPLRTLVVVGHQRQEVSKMLEDFNVEYVFQERQLGTGHAVLAAEQTLGGTDCTVLILCGDTPLIRPEILQEMYNYHLSRAAIITLMTTTLENPSNYGRILVGNGKDITGIVEEKDATPEQKAIQEINAGIYLVSEKFLFAALHRVGTDNSQGEVYLTDIISQAVEAGYKVEKFTTPCAKDVLGVNSRVELAVAHGELQDRRNKELMLQGITMYHPETISVSPEAAVGADTVLMPGVHIRGKCRIGSQCRIEPGVILENCTLGDHVQVGAYSCIADRIIQSNTVIPPHSLFQLPEGSMQCLFSATH